MENNHVLTIAGFDGSGGAGIQADLKTFSALGCYGMTALTALPIQNTVGVRSIYDISTQCVKDQLEAIFEDISVNAVKIGMLHREEIIKTVATVLRNFTPPNIVLDPVMVAKSGDKLLLPSCITAMKDLLFPIVTVLTPNLSESSEILGREIVTKNQMEQAAIKLVQMGPQAVVVKGGHCDGDCDDCLCLKNPEAEIYWFSHPRIQTLNTHGTGCTFSATIAAYLAKGFGIFDAVKFAKNYLTKSIESGAHFKIGHGNGPVDHMWNLLSVSKK